MPQKLLPKISLYFPQINNIRIFYIFTIVSSFCFIAGNWIFFWTKYMDYGHIGVIDSIVFTFALILEIPTGAISDIVGKRLTLICSMLFSFLGLLIIGLASSATWIFIGYMVAQVGWVLYSGASEALSYDTLIEKGMEDTYEKVISTSRILALISTVISSLLGAVLFMINFRFAYVAWSVVYLVGFIVSFFVTEPNVDTKTYSWSGYVKQIKNGTRELFKPSMRYFALLSLLSLGTFYLYDWGLLKPAIAIRFGFYNFGQSAVSAVLAVLGMIVVSKFSQYRKKFGDKRGIEVLIVIMAISLASVFLPWGKMGLVVLVVFGLAGTLAYPLISVVVNKRISSNNRATALSAVALLSKLPYSIFAISSGLLVDGGHLVLMCFIFGLVLLLSLLVSKIFLSTYE